MEPGWRASASIISARASIRISARRRTLPITDNIGSPRAALVYKPDENSSIYLSYGTSFNPSAETLRWRRRTRGWGRSGTTPTKWAAKSTAGWTAGTDGAAFNTVKTNARITDPLNPGLQTLAGTERVNGFEFGAQGHITENWELIAGYTYLAPRAVGLSPPVSLARSPMTARNQANLWTIYDFETA